ncbi:1629_t:CDS:2, partial [Funneliformis caledonium]
IPLDLERPPLPLLNTDGLSWDYQKSPKLEEELRVHVQNLYSMFKENKQDKSNTPIFFIMSGAGCGKSQNATEIPKILRRIFVNDPELESHLQEALIFNIPLENDTRINTSNKFDANVAIAKRMLYQFQNQGLYWTQIHDDMQTLSIIDILMSYDGMNKKSLFYSFMTEISIHATNRDLPFIIACCIAILARPFNKMVTVSHQQRTFLPICSLDPPKREVKLIFEDTPLLRMLINDMSENGRAFKALESALIDVDIENDSFVSIAEKVCNKLEDCYNEWINKTHYLTPVLRVILTHTTLIASVPILGTNILPKELSKLGLIKF